MMLLEDCLDEMERYREDFEREGTGITVNVSVSRSNAHQRAAEITVESGDDYDGQDPFRDVCHLVAVRVGPAYQVVAIRSLCTHKETGFVDLTAAYFASELPQAYGLREGSFLLAPIEEEISPASLHRSVEDMPLCVRYHRANGGASLSRIGLTCFDNYPAFIALQNSELPSEEPPYRTTEYFFSADNPHVSAGRAVLNFGPVSRLLVPRLSGAMLYTFPGEIPEQTIAAFAASISADNWHERLKEAPRLISINGSF
ncbi:hypothetical protein HYY74_06395 [Candidatus Woesearchaeota archaeon]|nr:hypothetical protein [Candidatus Woesearchaeota archaeon]